MEGRTRGVGRIEVRPVQVERLDQQELGDRARVEHRPEDRADLLADEQRLFKAERRKWNADVERGLKVVRPPHLPLGAAEAGDPVGRLHAQLLGVDVHRERRPPATGNLQHEAGLAESIQRQSLILRDDL